MPRTPVRGFPKFLLSSLAWGTVLTRRGKALLPRGQRIDQDESHVIPPPEALGYASSEGSDLFPAPTQNGASQNIGTHVPRVNIAFRVTWAVKPDATQGSTCPGMFTHYGQLREPRGGPTSAVGGTDTTTGVLATGQQGRKDGEACTRPQVLRGHLCAHGQ